LPEPAGSVGESQSRQSGSDGTCQTLQGAISQLNPGGEAIVLDSGGYGP